MSALTRIKQIIFGSGASSSQFGQIGSKSAGSPTNTKDLAVIQALTQYLNGLYAITANAVNPPYIEDLNALYLLITSQIAYVFEKGIPEWETGTDYYNLVSFVQVNGVVYQAIQDQVSSSHNPTSSPTFWRNVDPYTTAAGLASEIARAEAAEALLAPLASPTFTGTPRAPTQSGGDNSTKLATTAYVDSAVGAANPQIQNAVTEAGLPWDPTDLYMLDKAHVAASHVSGEDVFMNRKLTQVTFPNAKSSANPGNSRYLPVIARDVDKTVTTTHAPNLVPILRALTVSILGVTNFTGTVAASTITFSLSTTITAMLNVLVNEGLVRRWFSSGQSATFANSGADFTGMSVNIGGSDFAISAINVAAGTITVTGTPATGSQTMNLFPYRIVGSSTSIQLPRLSGFVPAGSDDVDGTQIGGYRIMDMEQDHIHGEAYANAGAVGLRVGGNTGANTYTLDGFTFTGGPSANTGTGTPRTSKKTAPQTTVKFIYMWVDYLAAAV